MSEAYTFKIEGQYKPDDIPLERLGDYLKALADVLGEPANVHFRNLTEGSVVAHIAVDHPAVPKVAHRVMAIATNAADDKLFAAVEKLDRMLAEDNATGELLATDNVIRVNFAGRNRPEPLVYGPMKQSGTLDGVVVRIEGRDATVHVGIVDNGRAWSLEAPSSMGRGLAALFHAGPVRFHGVGTWSRQGDGRWHLKKFVIARVEPLDNSPLSDVIDKARRAGPSEWSKLADPHDELRRVRGGEEALH
ncbi:hypothetical protein [Novosphingobium sp.]|uniref:hypothetical protein n=1 Tax=Novosphingobium sp. TaxID=1874826 RepID=UPI003B51D10F